MVKILQLLHPCLDHTSDENLELELARESCSDPASLIYMCVYNYFIEDIKHKDFSQTLFSPQNPDVKSRHPVLATLGRALRICAWKGDFYAFLPERNGVTVPFKTRGFTTSKRLTKTKFSRTIDRNFLVIRAGPVVCFAPDEKDLLELVALLNPGVSGWV